MRGGMIIAGIAQANTTIRKVVTQMYKIKMLIQRNKEKGYKRMAQRKGNQNNCVELFVAKLYSGTYKHTVASVCPYLSTI